MKVYRVRDWDKHFENSRSRAFTNLSWVPMPNRHDGSGFLELVDHPDGLAHYGAWALIVQVASRCQPRGTLLTARRQPYDSALIARMVRADPKVMAEAIERLVNIGWLEVYDELSADCQGADSALIAGCQGAIIERKKEKKERIERTEVAETASQSSAPINDNVVIEYPCDGKQTTWYLLQSKLNEYKDTFPHLNVEAQCRQALQWLKDNPQRRKTAGGMASFLTRWMTRATNSGSHAARAGGIIRGESRVSEETGVF